MTKKRGRPKKLNVDRTPSGQISRAASAYRENEEPIEVRMRMWGLSEVDARDQKSATVHGRMRLKKQITEQQYQAGEDMAKLYRSYLKAMSIPNAMEHGAGAGSERGASVEYEAWARGIVARWTGVRAAIREAQQVHRSANLWSALDYMNFRNEHHRHMEGDYAVLLHVVTVHFGLTKNSEAATVHEMSLSKICA
jgi:hypothetical protein